MLLSSLGAEPRTLWRLRGSRTHCKSTCITHSPDLVIIGSGPSTSLTCIPDAS